MTKQILESHLHLDNILDEMNLRARQYCGKGSGISIEESQKQAAQDFRNFNEGKYARSRRAR